MTTCSEWKCRNKAKWVKISKNGLTTYYFCNKHKKCAKRYSGKRLKEMFERGNYGE